MPALDRKLFRDPWRIKTQAAAIALVIGCGVSLFVGMVATYRSMRLSEHHYYTQWRFAQVWSDLSRAPSSVVREVAALPGVAAVDGRVKAHAILDVPGLAQPASAVFVSIPPTAGHGVYDLYVRRGRHVEPGHPGEALVSEAFAEKNHLVLGDMMVATVAGRHVRLRFVGVALSPEYVMPVPPSGLAPDDRRFAIIWMARDELQSLVGLRGAVNELTVLLSPGADERAVMAAVDRVLEPYGGRGAYGRTGQPSHTMLEEHISPLRSVSLIVPTIFLLVAAFLVNIVLSRFVATQREQIGLLKASGYSSGRVALHYLELTLLIVLAGVIVGLPVGARLGFGFARFYGAFFRFPVLVFRIEPGLILGALLLATVTTGLGALGAVRRVLALPPVVATTAEVPAFRRSLLESIGGSRWLGPAWRMVIRNVLKRPLRSGLAVAGMAFAVAVILIGSSTADATDRMRDVRYQAAERQDLTVSLTDARALGTALAFRGLPAVTRVEPYRIVPARFAGRGETQDLALFGLPAGGLLRNIVGNDYRARPVPPEGAIVTAWFAQHFGLKRGDPLPLEIREHRRHIVTTPVVDVVSEPLGVAVYMDLAALGRLLGEPETYSAANLSIDPVRERDLFATLKRTPAAAAVDFRKGSLQSFRQMSDAVAVFLRKVEVIFAIIIAFGVVYNAAKIALAERSRELSTLRVLGFARAEVSAILLGELGILAMAAVPLGLFLGNGLSRLVVGAWAGERMHPPLIVAPATYGLALLVFAVGVTGSALLVRRNLDRLDLVGVLKARD